MFRRTIKDIGGWLMDLKADAILSIIAATIATTLSVILKNNAGAFTFLNAFLFSPLMIGALIIFYLIVFALIFRYTGRFLIWISEYHFPKIPFRFHCKTYTRKIDNNLTDIYIEVRNLEHFIDAVSIFVCCQFMYKGEIIRDPIKWEGFHLKNGETFLRRRKKRLLHFATIDTNQKEYYLHLLERDLEFSFQDGRVFSLLIEGITSSNKPFKSKIGRQIAVSESVNAEIDFKVFYQG